MIDIYSQAAANSNMEPMLSLMSWMGLGLVGVGFLLFLVARRMEFDKGPFVYAMSVGVLLVLSARVFIPAVTRLIEKIEEAEASPSTGATPSPEVTAAPTPEPAQSPAPAASSPVDWSFLPWVVGAVVVLAAVVLLIFVWRAHLGPKASIAAAARRTRAGQIKAGQKAWAAARAQFGVTQTTWLSYEKDLQRAMDFPLMRDMHNPLVQRTVSAMSAASAFDRSQAPLIAEDVEPTQQPFVLAVREFVDALSAAEAQARVARRTRLSKDHQKALKLADRLLKIAQNDGASPHERQNALRQLTRTLEGIIDIPVEAIAQIETAVRFSIEAAAHGAQVREMAIR